MAICCWSFDAPGPIQEINLAVKGAKRAQEAAQKLAGLRPGERWSPRLQDPPDGPVQHIDGGSPLDLGRMSAFTFLEVSVGSEPSREIAVELDGSRVRLAVPNVMIPELASLIGESYEIKLADETWMYARLKNSTQANVEGRLRIWTWSPGGLLIGG